MTHRLFARSSTEITDLGGRLRDRPASAPAARAPFLARGPDDATAAVRPLFWAADAVVADGTRPPPAPEVGADIERRLAEVRAQVERDGRDAVHAAIGAMEDKLAVSLERLDRAVLRTSRPSAHEVIELALIAAAEIVGREVSVDRDGLIRAIDEAMASTGDEAPSAVVKVAPADLAWIHANCPDRFTALRLVEDPRLTAGGCVVETTRRVIDASIEARFDAVRRSLQVALRDGGEEPAP